MGIDHSETLEGICIRCLYPPALRDGGSRCLIFFSLCSIHRIHRDIIEGRDGKYGTSYLQLTLLVGFHFDSLGRNPFS